MRFTPQSEEEIKKAMLIPAGEYDFQVVEATEKTSSGGHQMIEMKIIVWFDGNQYHVRDWLMVDLPMQQYKVIHFCRATGIMNRYNAGNLEASDCLGRSGQLVLICKEARKGKDGKDYGPQNNVKDYIVDSVQGQGDDFVREPSTPEKQSSARMIDSTEEYPF